MSKMFTDMSLVEDLMKEFKTKQNGGVVSNVEMHAEVLTNDIWPEQQKSKCKLPGQLLMCSTKFEEFYKFKH
jgi:hypothetical protein